MYKDILNIAFSNCPDELFSLLYQAVLFPKGFDDFLTVLDVLPLQLIEFTKSFNTRES